MQVDLSIILNGYGPTENSGLTTTYLIPHDFDEQAAIPIGRPITNTTVFVLNENHQLAAIGEYGELYTGGDGVARGYLNRPELNHQQFVVNPITKNINDRLYRTGDIVYWRADGNLEFVGRKDLQVKICGCRIELGAVENALLNYPEIVQSAVLALSNLESDKYLCAFLVVRAEWVVNLTALKQFLLTFLPPYSVPEVFITLEKLPLTPHGKTDREALSQLAQFRHFSLTQDLPKTDIEKQLANIWSELLGIPSISRQVDFFSLGGHSSLLLRLQNKIEYAYHCEISLTQLLSVTTIVKQAELLEKKLAFSNNSAVIFLQPQGEQPQLFLFPPISNDYVCFLSLSRYLNSDHPVCAIV